MLTFKEVDQWNFIADRKILEAMEEGAFDQLEGTGEPLDLRENPFEDPSMRMAHRILKNNGLAPAWIEESKEIDSEIRRLRSHPEANAIVALNRRILAFNLKAPTVSVHKQLFEISR